MRSIILSLFLSMNLFASTQDALEPAQKFVQDATDQLSKIGKEVYYAAWDFNTDLKNKEKADKYSKLSAEISLLGVQLAQQAAKFDGLALDEDTKRKLFTLKLASSAPPPNDAAKAARLAEISTQMDKIYSEGQVCTGDKCISGNEAEKLMGTSQDPDVLLSTWNKWRKNSAAMKPLYEEFVSLSNQGSNDLGFKDTGALWRSGYDMPAKEFPAVVDKLWDQVKPFYESLHCFVRGKLNEQYPSVVSKEGTIPAHMLGNMWAQSWGNVYERVASELERPYDLTDLMVSKNYSVEKIFRDGENFFVSLGFPKLPQTFWDNSMFVHPQDGRKAVCHASAWDLDLSKENLDVRVKMCTNIDGEDFITVHHELGHIFYYLAYQNQHPLYQTGANDGFHEAVGDTIALSITPKYLKQIGLLDEVPDASKDIALLLDTALDKVAFLPFGLLVDKWRWGVFSGEIKPENYNQAWWDLRKKYQGIAPTVDRDADAFDPGSKYHIPGNTPYMRYFLAHILQFQFHRELCKIAGHEGPLHRCSIFGNEKAGSRLLQMLSLGSSRPWQEALAAVSPDGKMDASAVAEYFAPLKTWLDEQNKNQTCGW